MNNIVSILLPIVVIGLVAWLFLRSRQGRKPKAAKDTHITRQERAVWAWARVVSAQRSEPDAIGRMRVKMQLEVHLADTPPYSATTTWLVEKDALEYVEEGKEVPLKVDPQGTQYVYPNGPWAKFAG